MTRRGWLLFLAVGVIWGLPYLLIRVSVREVSPALLVLLRTGGGAILLGPIAAARGQLRPVLAHWRPVLVFTLVEMGVPWFLLFHAEEKLSSSLSGLLIAAVPLVSALLAWATGSERLDLRRVIGLLVGFGGVASLVGFAVRSDDLASALSLGVVACGYALGPWVLARYLSDLPAVGVIAASLIACAVVYAPIAAFELPHRGLTGSVIGSIVGLTVVCTAAAFLLFFALIAEVGATRATVITYVNPAIAVVLGVTILNEHFGVATGVGFALILAGCLLATRRTPASSSDSLPTPSPTTPVPPEASRTER
jgi:drug/metabolite transporter (DMT)-like permease